MATIDRTERRPEPICDDRFEQLDLLDASEMRVRVDLAVALTREIRGLGLTQAEAVEISCVAQSDIAKLMSGDVEGISLEHLAQLLNSVGGNR